MPPRSCTQARPVPRTPRAAWIALLLLLLPSCKVFWPDEPPPPRPRPRDDFRAAADSPHVAADAESGFSFSFPAARKAPGRVQEPPEAGLFDEGTFLDIGFGYAGNDGEQGWLDNLYAELGLQFLAHHTALARLQFPVRENPGFLVGYRFSLPLHEWFSLNASLLLGYYKYEFEEFYGFPSYARVRYEYEFYARFHLSATLRYEGFGLQAGFGIYGGPDAGEFEISIGLTYRLGL